MGQRPMKLKMLDSFYDRITNRKSQLPIYHGNDVKEFIPANTEKKPKKQNPFTATINYSEVQAFVHRLEADRRVGLAGIGIWHKGRQITEHYVQPYKETYRHVSFSLCKSVVSMAIGIAEGEHLLTLEEKLVDIFPEYTGIRTKKWMKEITISHLLTMTAGVKFDEVSSYFVKDWCKAFINSEVSFRPGTDFAYNSLNTYMLAAILTRRAGCSLMAYLKSRLFYPLGINDVTWDCCPMGIERGGWGMKLSLQDMLKLGQLYLDRGAVIQNGKKRQLIPESWIVRSTQAQVVFEDTEITKGYGYQIWCLQDGAYLFNGVFGQNIYVHPRKQLVIACTAGGYEIFPEGHFVGALCEFASRKTLFHINPCKNIGCLMVEAGKTIWNTHKNRNSDAAYSAYVFEMLRPYLNKKYVINSYASSILPVANQLFYSTYMTGMERLLLTQEGEHLLLHVRDGRKMYTIRLGVRKSEPYCYQILDFHGKKMPVAAGLVPEVTEEPGCSFLIHLCYLEEVAGKRIKLQFDKDRVQICTVDTPNMTDFLQKLMGETMMQRTKKLGKFRQSAFVKEKLKKVLFPKSEGIAR